LADASADTLFMATASLALISSNRVFKNNLDFVTDSVITASNIASSLSLLTISDPSKKSSLSVQCYTAATNLASAGLGFIPYQNDIVKNRVVSIANRKFVNLDFDANKNVSVQYVRSLSDDQLQSLNDAQSSLESSVWMVTKNFFSDIVIGDPILHYSSSYFDIFLGKDWVNRHNLVLNVSDSFQFQDNALVKDSSFSLGYSVFFSRLRTVQFSAEKFSNSIYATVTYDSESSFQPPIVVTKFAINSTISSYLVPAVKNVSCDGGNRSYELEISCSSTETGGGEYVGLITCLQNVPEIVYFTCPTYNWTSICLVNGVYEPSCVAINLSDGYATCICSDKALNYTLSTTSFSSTKLNHLQMSSSFQLNQRRSVSTLSSEYRVPLIHSNNSESSSSAINLIAIIALVLGFLVAFGCGAKKIYDYSLANDVPVTTSASVVSSNITVHVPDKNTIQVDLNVLNDLNLEQYDIEACKEALAVPI